MIYSDVLRDIKTIQHAKELAYEIDILLDSLFKTESKSFEKALNSISIANAELLKEGFLKNNIHLGTEAMIEFLVGLKEKLQKLKTLNIMIAFEPSQNLIDALFDWVLRNLGFGIVLDLKKDKAILGGAIIEFGGKYRDFTLRKTLEETFEKRREEILTHLSS